MVDLKTKKRIEKMYFENAIKGLECLCRECGKEYFENKSRADYKGYCSNKCLREMAKRYGWKKGLNENDYLRGRIGSVFKGSDFSAIDTKIEEHDGHFEVMYRFHSKNYWEYLRDCYGDGRKFDSEAGAKAALDKFLRSDKK